MSQYSSLNKLSRHDDIYNLLMDLHEDKSESESLKLNAKLILALMNFIGDDQKCVEIITHIARGQSFG